jgi:hypothetical protein
MDRVLVFDENGNYRRFPTCWTDYDDPDPFLDISAGRAFTREEGLLEISALLLYIAAEVSTQSCQSVKQIMSHHLD